MLLHQLPKKILKPKEKIIIKGGEKLSKVKFGGKYFLVPKSLLRGFCERAAGLSANLADYSYYLVKEEEDEKNRLAGIPVVPEKYKNLIRFPIEVKINGVDKRKTI